MPCADPKFNSRKVSSEVGRFSVTATCLDRSVRLAKPVLTLVVFVVTAGVVIQHGFIAEAQAQVWTGAVSDSWSDGANWSLGALPATNSQVSVNYASPNVAIADGVVYTTNRRLNMGGLAGLTGTLTLENGANFTVAGIMLGASGTGDLTLLDSHLSSLGNVSIAFLQQGSGSLTVSGSTASFNVLGGSYLDVGASGQGSLTVLGGGTVTAFNGFVGDNTGSRGSVLVSGPGSLWTIGDTFGVGGDGEATVLIEDGGGITAGGLTGVGFGADSNSFLTVTGIGSYLTATDLVVGSAGTGQLSILDGSTVTTVNGFVGDYSGSQGTVIVRGTGSLWTIGDTFGVGGDGNGNVLIENGGAVAAGGVAGVGFGSNSDSSVTIRGGGSSLTSAGLVIGGAGRAQIIVRDGAMVETSEVSMAENAGSDGLLFLAGDQNARGVLVASGVTRGAGSASIVFDGGILRASQSTSDFLSGFTIGDVLLLPEGGIIDTNGFDVGISVGVVGPGALTKAGAGLLIMNADNYYSGGTLVQAGTLEVNGTVGDVTVDQDGRLQGSGTVGNLAVSGTIAAGSGYPRPENGEPTAFGSLWVDGDLTLSDSSLFELKVDAEGNADLVEVNGTAYLDGQLLTLASGGDYADATEYTFLRAEGGIEGEFDGVSASLAFLDATLAYNENDVRLTLARNRTSFSDIGATRNQRATAGAVEALGAGNVVYDRVLTLGADDARAGFDQLSGEVHASLKGALLTSSQSLGDTMNDRVAAAFARRGAAGDDTANGLGIWSSASGRIGVLQANGNAAAANYSAGNQFVGADVMFNQNWMLGALVGFGSTGISVAERSSTATGDNYHIGVYGGGQIADFTVKFGAGYTQHEIHVNRTVTMPGFTESLFSSRSGGTSQFFGEIGHKFAFDSGLIIEPVANLAYASLFTGGFAEQGGAAALSGGASHASTTHLTLGIRGEIPFTLGEVHATARGMIGWRHGLGGVEPTSTQAFGTGPTFTVGGSEVARDSAIVELGLDLNLAPNVDLGVSYNGQFGSDQQHGVRATLSISF